MGSTGGEVEAAGSASPRRNLWAGIADWVRQDMGRGGAATILLILLSVLGPLLLLAMTGGADAFGGPNVAFVVSLSLAVIGVGTLIAMFFIGVNYMRMNEKRWKAYAEDRKKNEEMRKAFYEDRKKNEEMRKAFYEDRKKNEERWNALMQFIEERAWSVPADLDVSEPPPADKETAGG